MRRVAWMIAAPGKIAGFALLWLLTLALAAGCGPQPRAQSPHDDGSSSTNREHEREPTKKENGKGKPEEGKPKKEKPEEGKPAEFELCSLTSLPAWTDKYAASNQGDFRYFNISALMERHQLSRLQAVELQNHYRDLTRTDPDTIGDEAFETSLTRVRQNQFESGLDSARLANASFILVLDLDETLYDQYGVDESCADFSYQREDGSEKHILRLPGWERLIDGARELGGEVVFFSANVDDAVYQNLTRWTLDGESLVESDAIAGVLTNSHLVLQSKHEGAGAENPRRGNPVAIPSKDLRIFDESLQKVIIIDDNPTRLFQHRNVRVAKKLRSELACSEEGREVFEKQMETVLLELRDSARAASEMSIPFNVAWAPYSLTGELALEALMSAGKTRKDAIQFLRENPEWIDEDF